MIRTKAFLIAVCVGLLQCKRGLGIQFEFAPDGSPCILMDIEEATFNLTKGDKASPLFQITADTNVTLTKSRCDPDKSSNILTLKLDTGESLKFKFSLNGANVVMETILSVVPSKHFENDTTAKFELQTGEKLQLGPQDKSFQCSGEDLAFDQDLPYYMTMEIRGLHVQAYNLSDTYSPAEVCSADITSTPPATTKPASETTKPASVTTKPASETTKPASVTTKPASETTKPASETTKPASETTKPAPETTKPATETTPTTASTQSTGPTTVSTLPTTTSPPTVPKYALKNGNETYCVVLQGYLKFDILYNSFFGNETELKTARITIPDNATIKGNCYVDDFTQEMTLSFFDGWNFSVIFGKEPVSMTRRRLLAEGETYAWKEFSLTYVYDDNFEKPADSGKQTTVTNAPDGGAFQGQGEAGFKCNAAVKQELTGGEGADNVQMDVSDLRYRAFGDTEDDTLSDTGYVECPEDKTDDGGDDDTNVGAIVGGVIGGVVFIIILIGVAMHCRNKRRKDYVVM